MKEYKMIALDLDGTLLTTEKDLPEENRSSLEKAALKGIEIVPTTGRFYNGMPACIRELPFIHYAVTMNGAEVIDTMTGSVLYRAEIPNDIALSITSFFDEHNVIYDCYMGGQAFMTASMLKKTDDYTTVPYYRAMIKNLRQPVKSLPDYIREQGMGVQKMQCFTTDHSYLKNILNELREKFPMLSVTSSIPDNLELNIASANKGDALTALSSILGFSMDQVMTFGDGLNDLSMIQAAGLGVAMANSIPEILQAADYVTLDNDSCGVAAAINRFIGQ